MELLGGYTLGNSLLDFFIYLLKEETEEKQWEVWLHKPVEVGFEEFKKKTTQKARQRHNNVDEKTAVAKATNILKFRSYKEVGG